MEAESVPSSFPAGAALVAGGDGWVLLGAGVASNLGAALAWGRRVAVARLHVVVDDPAAAGVLARRARAFTSAPSVWLAHGSDLKPATAEPAAVPLPGPDAPELRALLADAGLTVVDEDGVVLGELLGLEVARISHGPDGPELTVGVGRFDRELGEMTHAHLDPPARLARVVEIVARYRRPGAPPHPLNRLVPERWLRAALLADPASVGAAELVSVPSVGGRQNLLERGIAAALGRARDGSDVVVVCSTGVDLDLVPAAADDRAVHAPEARLVLAVPARDALPLTRDLAAALAEPADVVGVDGDWRIPWA